MITDEQFKEYINKLSDSYEAIKDLVYAKGSPLNPIGKTAQGIIGELSNFRDIACTALRKAHTAKNFEDN